MVDSLNISNGLNYSYNPQTRQSDSNPCGGGYRGINPTSFRGGKTSAALAVQAPDTVEISAENKVKTANKKKRLSTGAKIALGIVGTAATIYAGVVTHRFIKRPNFDKVQKNFSEIFRRNVSADEAKKLVDDYKDLLKIENKDEFCQKAFEQVKKDYGYKDLDIKLELEYMPDEKLSTFMSRKTLASWSDESCRVKLYLPITKENKHPLGDFQKFEIIDNLMHEFQHAKQSEYMYRTSPDKLIDATLKRHKDRNLVDDLEELLTDEYKLKSQAKKEGITVEELKETIQKGINAMKEQGVKPAINEKKSRADHRDILDKVFGGFKKFDVVSDDYNLGLKYIDNCANYIDGKKDITKYQAQLIEKEAFDVNKKFNEIYNYFANPWRVF